MKQNNSRWTRSSLRLRAQRRQEKMHRDLNLNHPQLYSNLHKSIIRKMMPRHLRRNSFKRLPARKRGRSRCRRQQQRACSPIRNAQALWPIHSSLRRRVFCLHRSSCSLMCRSKETSLRKCREGTKTFLICTSTSQLSIQTCSSHTLIKINRRRNSVMSTRKAAPFPSAGSSTTAFKARLSNRMPYLRSSWRQRTRRISRSSLPSIKR